MNKPPPDYGIALRTSLIASLCSEMLSVADCALLRYTETVNQITTAIIMMIAITSTISTNVKPFFVLCNFTIPLSSNSKCGYLHFVHIYDTIILCVFSECNRFLQKYQAKLDFFVEIL